MQTVRHNGVLLAVYVKSDDIPDGRFFFGVGDEPLQWGTQSLADGTVIQAHVHKPRSRLFKSKTIEVFVMLAGRMVADIYSLDRVRLESLVLRAGDILVTYDGGHGFTVLDKGTKFVEAKLGPFTAVEDDKEKF